MQKDPHLDKKYLLYKKVSSSTAEMKFLKIYTMIVIKTMF